MKKKEAMKRKRAICIVLACILLVGTISVGFITYAPDNTSKTTYANDEKQASDYFYLQIYNSEDQIATKYKITLTGMVSSTSREITSVSFDLVSGDTCETDYDIDGNTVSVTITHPTEGCLVRIFTLSTSGVFSAI